MKKLKVYKNPDFRLVEMRTYGYIMNDGIIGGSKTGEMNESSDVPTQPGLGVDDGDAPIFRPGIWDED